MVTEDYCSFEVSKLLKEKGFNGECIGCWHSQNKLFEVHYEPLSYSDDLREEIILAPTHQMAMKWLREEHKLFIDISFQKDEDNSVTWFYMTWAFDDRKRDVEEVDFTSYEEAVEAALKYVLEKFELSTEEFDPYMED